MHESQQVKQKLNIKSTLLVFMALLVFLFGNSVNVWHHCCDMCFGHEHYVVSEVHSKEKGNESCCLGDRHLGVTENHMHECAGSCDQTLRHHSCFLENVSIVLDENVSRSVQLIPSIFVYQAFLPTLSRFELDSPPLLLIYRSGLPPLEGRQILAKNCILRC